jgi:hypothetical protein
MQRRNGFAIGVVGGAAGLAAMELTRAITHPVMPPARKPGHVFATDGDRSMSPLGPRNRPDESATDTLGRIVYEKVLRRPPSSRTQKVLSWAIHIGYGLAWAGVFGAFGRPARRALRTGALFGAALWLFGDELAVPLFGLSDKPTTYHPARHAQSLLQHLGYGVATTAVTRALARR